MEFNFSDEHRVISQKEFNELIEALRAGILASQIPGSLVPRTDTKFLSTFLRTKDYKLASALAAVLKYYACVHKNLSFIDGLTPRIYTSAFNSNVFTIFKHRFNGVRVGLVRVRNWIPKDVELKGLQISAIYIFEEYVRKNIDMQENGIEVIFDLQGARLDHLKKLSLKELRRITNTTQDGVPVRVAGVHFLNPSKLIWPIFQLTLKMMKEKIRKRVHLHYGFESLHQCLNKEFLPQSLGGDLSEEDAAERHVIDRILEENYPMEEYWNGAYVKGQRYERRLSRKRSHDVGC